MNADKNALSEEGVINNYMDLISLERHPDLYALLVSQFWFWDLYDTTLNILLSKVTIIHKEKICLAALNFKECPQGIDLLKFEERKFLLQQHLEGKIAPSWWVKFI